MQTQLLSGIRKRGVNVVDDCVAAAKAAEGEIASLSYPITQLPQMRRSRLFKLLENCGVSIAQGKGSELKLLRKDAHPFRLGCHYGPNPTVPSFLIALILKRLQITRNEWQQAIAELRIAGS